MRPVLTVVLAVVVIVGVAGAQARQSEDDATRNATGLSGGRAGATDTDDDGEEDDSAWGVSGPLDDLDDDLELEDRYPDQFGGAEVFYDRNLLEVGWKGEVPEALIAELAKRGQSDWVQFVPVLYNAQELYDSAGILMDRLDEAGIECHSGGGLDDGSAAYAKYYDRPRGTRQRAERIAHQVSTELGIPVRAIITTEPLAVAAAG